MPRLLVSPLLPLSAATPPSPPPAPPLLLRFVRIPPDPPAHRFLLERKGHRQEDDIRVQPPMKLGLATLLLEGRRSSGAVLVPPNQASLPMTSTQSGSTTKDMPWQGTWRWRWRRKMRSGQNRVYWQRLERCGATFDNKLCCLRQWEDGRSNRTRHLARMTAWPSYGRPQPLPSGAVLFFLPFDCSVATSSNRRKIKP